jgi:hypothetical protein
VHPTTVCSPTDLASPDIDMPTYSPNEKPSTGLEPAPRSDTDPAPLRARRRWNRFRRRGSAEKARNGDHDEARRNYPPRREEFMDEAAMKREANRL